MLTMMKRNSMIIGDVFFLKLKNKGVFFLYFFIIIIIFFVLEIIELISSIFEIYSFFFVPEINIKRNHKVIHTHAVCNV